jgi:hypothetical protein
MSAREFIELPANTRQRIEALIATLIDLLDQIDADGELDDDGDAEPDAVPVHNRGGNGWAPSRR